ncbi:YafY family protein [Selenomonas sp. AE3005]|uniref:helix-turn-helix transcriptional regulator n=1 Tax=Selenomonas sp. AE3005 TaxID=1485543 RepID=UPI00048A2D72|nr:WYL domain-containing protein [Selenomonas sp. AE3005]
MAEDQQKSLQLLLLVDALRRATKTDPKNVNDLRQDIENALREIFPDKKIVPISASTINRHIKAMNESGLYKIVTCKDMRKGYYNDNFLFDAAEFSIIAQSLYRSTTLSVSETEKILRKFLSNTDDLGEGYLDIMDKQIRRTAPRRKSARDNLPIIHVIMKAILEGRQIAFKYFSWDAKHQKMKGPLKSEDDGGTKTFFVSPYYLVWETDECYLIGYVEEDKPVKKHHLTHFKISCITSSVHSITKDCTPLCEMQEYPRYSMKRTLPESMAIYRKEKEGSNSLASVKDIVKFSLDRYMRENLFMVHDNKPVVDVKLHFRAEFIGDILARFNLDDRTLAAKPTTRIVGNQRIYSAVITVQPNEGFYKWLMGNSNYVMVVEPEIIRSRLKQRLNRALTAIEQYEKAEEKDPIDYDALQMKKKGDYLTEMWRDMLIIPAESNDKRKK